MFAAVFALDESSFVFCGTAVLGMDCESRSSSAMAFSPASVNFNEYAWARFLVASPGFHSRLRFDLAHEAGLQ